MFGFLRPHPGKGRRLGTARDWAELKAVSDIPNADDRKYWRVHDDYYDLSNFDHPGGVDWINITKGNDVTELFESSHPDIEKARLLLKKYKVTSTKEPRNSGAFTFEKDGFYSVFRERAWKSLKKTGSGPTLQMLFIHDSLLAAFLILLTCTMNPFIDLRSWLALSIFAGVFLQCLGTCSHNFYHRRKNWRMYTWDLTPYSSFEWRISHCYSHHVFANTAYDYECMAFEPFLLWLPVPKSFLRLLLTPIMIFLLSAIGMHMQVIQYFLGYFLFKSGCYNGLSFTFRVFYVM